MLVIAVGASAARAEASGDPWYEDMGEHWSYDYVKTLWEEDLTDGEVKRHGQHDHKYAKYYPASESSRAQYAVMLAKAFRLTPMREDEPRFSDVPQWYRFFNKPVFGYIQAAASTGIIEGYPDGRFLPDADITREQAFAILVRSLDLGAYAEGLGDGDVSRILKGFRDWQSISRSLEREIAAAAKLGIVEGYPDGRLKPSQPMTRAEAATVVYRSCLVRASANPYDFSPDGDGVEDETRFEILSLKNRGTRRWSLFITDYWGTVLKHMYDIDPGPPPPLVLWDGSSKSVPRLPNGTYYYRARVTDRKDQVFWSALKPVVLSSRSLTGYVSPPVLQPGDSATVAGYATGQTLSVEASTPWAGYSPMVYLDGSWRLVFIVPKDARDGDYSVRLRAAYPKTSRTAVAGFEVQQLVSIEGGLSPNPCSPGQSVVVDARASPNVVRVQAACAALGVQGLSLERDSSLDEWRGTFAVPHDASAGRYTVTLTASTLTKSKNLDLDLFVDEDPLEDVTFSLTG